MANGQHEDCQPPDAEAKQAREEVPQTIRQAVAPPLHRDVDKLRGDVDMPMEGKTT
jgi:hypothetical protein